MGSLWPDWGQDLGELPVISLEFHWKALESIGKALNLSLVGSKARAWFPFKSSIGQVE